jgi:hypothetical protein
MSQPKGPYRLVTVNTSPERAKRLVGRVVEALKDDYMIDHVANCECMQHTPSEMPAALMTCSYRRSRAKTPGLQT